MQPIAHAFEAIETFERIVNDRPQRYVSGQIYNIREGNQELLQHAQEWQKQRLVNFVSPEYGRSLGYFVGTGKATP